jgi:CRISPR-associated protein (TIGR02710 family)
MTDVLIVTLGTSVQPIINCISSLRPERVVFLCSTETQNLVQTVLREVPLPDFSDARDVVVLQQRQHSSDSEEVCNELDQLDSVYIRALNLFAELRQQIPGCRLIANYTGGTKTMTIGLAMAAIDDGTVNVHLTGSDRSRGQTALSGYSAPFAVSTAAIHTRRLQDRELPALLKRHDYAAARQAVRMVQGYADPDSGLLRGLRRLEALLVALDAWDCFDHRMAHDVLAQLADRSLDQQLLFPLKRVIGSRRLLDRAADEQQWPKMKGHGLEAVEDLLRNAERRATQERFDDAVGRLYRAMELTAQLLLKVAVTEKVGPEGIDTGRVDLDCLPTGIQPRWRELAATKAAGCRAQTFRIGLSDSYDLLADLDHPTGLEWKEQRKTIVSALETRNQSLFAHGFAPIGYPQWRSFSEKVIGFLGSAISRQRDKNPFQGKALPELLQFPTTLADLLPELDSSKTAEIT